MRLTPTHCEHCGRDTLVNGAELTNGKGSCARCGGVARRLTHDSYEPEEAVTFLELSALVRDAELTPGAACALSSELHSLAGSPGAGFELLQASLPDFAPLALIVPNDLARRRTAEKLLLALLEARSRGVRASGAGLRAYAPLMPPRVRGRR